MTIFRHLSGLIHLDNFIVTRYILLIYQDFAKTKQNHIWNIFCCLQINTNLYRIEMKKLTLLIVLFISFFINNSCEKDYENEIFVDNFKYVYGEWRHYETMGGWTGGFRSYDDYNVEFTPNAKFSYNGGKTGVIKLISQSDRSVLIDFNSLFPRADRGYVGLI
jgi:hypothetical protein